MPEPWSDWVERGGGLPPFFEVLGLSLEEVSEARVVVRMNVPETLVTPFGTIHGGFLAAMIDTVGGLAVTFKLGLLGGVATHSLALTYTSFIKDRTCVCVGTVVALAANVATVEFEVTRPDGKVAVKALGVYGIRRPKE